MTKQTNYSFSWFDIGAQPILEFNVAGEVGDFETLNILSEALDSRPGQSDVRILYVNPTNHFILKDKLIMSALTEFSKRNIRRFALASITDGGKFDEQNETAIDVGEALSLKVDVQRFSDRDQAIDWLCALA